ncbi:MAG: carboxypeptidase regulatory-like domain-containing protein [Planctomycetales bacterium]|nr:carboxypeptidase regulatory-like domain-containing protein [Planctomycetales bacterium]
MLKRHLTTILIALFFVSPALALITGGRTEPINVSGLPAGSEPLANLTSRIAWWEGPPFGGGQYHFEYAGETSDLQKAVDLFAKVESNRKQLVVRAGEQESFWLTIGDKSTKHPMDWQFVVWVPANWQHLRDAKAGLLPPGEEGDAPKTEMVVFVSDRIDWNAIKIPEGINVIDERLESNGIPADQGAALKGAVTDENGKPITGATVSIGKDPDVIRGTSNSRGQYLVKQIPAGTHQIKVSAPGFASKDVYYYEFTPSNLRTINVSLAKSATVRVRAVDAANNPVPEVKVIVYHCKDRQGNDYRIARQREFTANSKGEFDLDDVPEGTIKFGCATKGYYYNSVLNEHDTAESPIVLKLLPTGNVKVNVFSPDGQSVNARYVIQINEKGVDPEKGGKAGSWGGSANVGTDGTYTFENVPSGDYVVTGKPNPGASKDRAQAVNVQIKPKETVEIKLVTK